MPLAFYSRRSRSFLACFYLCSIFYFMTAHQIIFRFTPDSQLLLIEVGGVGGCGLCAIDAAVMPLAFTLDARARRLTVFNCFALLS